MKKYELLIGSLIGLCFIGIVGIIQLNAQPASLAEKINWVSIEEAEKLAAKDGKKILVDVYTDWCGWCKVMDKNTYANQQIADYINANFHAVKLDAEQREDINVMDRSFKFVASGRRGYHEYAAAILNGQMSYPSTVFLQADMRPLYVVPGYLKPDQMSPILSYTFEEVYKKNISFQDYQKSLKSPGR